MAKNGFNIATRAVAETGICELLDEFDEPLIGDDGKQASITLYGPGSKPYLAAEAAKNNAVLELVRKRGKGDLPPETTRRLDADRLAALTVSFNNFTYAPEDGTEFASDEEMFAAAYMDAGIGYIRQQAFAFLGDWGNFSARSAKK